RHKTGGENSRVVEKMGELDSFRYVEFASRKLKGFRNRVVELREVRSLLEQLGNSDCFSSYYFFPDELVSYVKEHGGSVAGFRGPALARVLHVDVDAAELERALMTARELCLFMAEYWGASQEALFPYFSGSKGFHVGIHTGVFGEVEPSERLPDVFHRALGALVWQARLTCDDTVDYSVGRRLSLLRLPNTRHSGSGLYKVPLTLHELMNCSVEEIRGLAGSPREPYFTDATGLVPLCEVEPLADAADLYERCVQECREAREGHLPAPEGFLSSERLTTALCDAEMVLYHEGIPEGARSRTALRLASRMRCAGYPAEEATGLLLAWNERNRPPLEPREVSRIAGAAYEAEVPYQFGCGTGGDDPPETRLVYEACPYQDRMMCEMYRRFRAGVEVSA
ncbi:MAG: primase C-terminal domain-containing protein, partial [Gemmatimonadales bacterium]